MSNLKTWQAMESNDQLQGFGRLNKKGNPNRRRRVAAAAKLIVDVTSGKAPIYYLKEAIAPTSYQAARMINSNYPVFIFGESGTRSDFPLLTGDVLNRMLLAQYTEYPMPYENYVSINRNLRDFRTSRMLAYDNAEGVFNVREEGQELEYRSPDEKDYNFSPKKYLAGIQISFEAIINDDLDAFMRIPEKLARGARRTPAKFATSLYCDTNGPFSPFYSLANNNLITDQLSMAGLQNAIKLLDEQVDDDGEPIFFEVIHLVVPPALRVIGNNLINTLTFDSNATASGGDTDNEIRVRNWLPGQLQLWVDPYIPIVAKDARAAGRQPWFLFGDPNSGRPAIHIGFLRGYDAPVLYQKLADTIRVGGGIDQNAGDWETMSQSYKAIIAFGGLRIDHKTTVASDATG